MAKKGVEDDVMDVDEPVTDVTPEDEADLSGLDRGDNLDGSEAPVTEAQAEPEADTEADTEVEAEDETPEITAETDDAEPDKKPDKPKSHMIPKERFDEVNERRKAAEAALAEREAREAAAQAAQQGTFDYDAKESEYMEAMLDGDQEKALAIRKEIRAAEQAEYVSQARSEAAEARTAAAQDVEINAAIRDANTMYPMFDPESEEFNAELTDEAVAMIIGYRNPPLNLPYTAALNKALNNMARLYDLKPAGYEETEASEAPAKPKPKAADVQKKVDAAKGQPPKPGAAATDVDPTKVDITTMSDEDMAALPAAALRRLRGDLVA